MFGALLAKGYLAEAPASREPGTLVWDHDDQDNPITLVTTADGLTVIGVEPEGSDAPDADAAPDTATEGATGAQDSGVAAENASSGEGAPAGDEAADSGARKERKVRAGTKQAQLIEMLRAPEGATIDEIAAATGWQPHTVRGAIAGALKEVTSEKIDARGRVRRLPAA